MIRRPLIILTLGCFLLSTIIGPMPKAQAGEFLLPLPGVMVHLSPDFNPPVLKGIKVQPDNPFQFEFILDKGDTELNSVQLKDESSKLVKYFLASLTIPEKDLWVNLSPYEKDRIIPNSFGLTEMGRDLLGEDYMLKQITASLIYPEDGIGKRFWKRIYEEAQRKYGTTDIPVNTFNKVWIVPEKAVVFENAQAGTAYVVESKLKVMLEQDYLSLQKHAGIQAEASVKNTSQLGNQIVREIVIPALTTEVNENRNFAKLRQVYNSLILATWYKNKIKDSILSKVYTDKRKVAGVNNTDPNEKNKIYQRYLKAFKKGVYNYIKEDIDPVSQEMIPRKYFSGGFDLQPSKAMIVIDRLTDKLRSTLSSLKPLLLTVAITAVAAVSALGAENNTPVNDQRQQTIMLGVQVLNNVMGKEIKPSETNLPTLANKALPILKTYLKKYSSYSFHYPYVGKDGKVTVYDIGAPRALSYIENHPDALNPNDPTVIEAMFKAIDEMSKINSNLRNDFIARLFKSPNNKENAKTNLVLINDLNAMIDKNMDFPDVFDAQQILTDLKNKGVALDFRLDQKKNTMTIVIKTSQGTETAVFDWKLLQASTAPKSKSLLSLYLLAGVLGLQFIDWLRTNKDLKKVKNETQAPVKEVAKPPVIIKETVYYPNLKEKINDLKVKKAREASDKSKRNMAEMIKKLQDNKEDRLVWIKDALGVSLDVNEWIVSLKRSMSKDPKNSNEYRQLMTDLQLFKNTFDEVFYPLDEARIDAQLLIKKEKKMSETGDQRLFEAIDRKISELTESGVMKRAADAADRILSASPVLLDFSNDPLYVFKQTAYDLSKDISGQIGQRTTKESQGNGLLTVLDGLGKWDDTNYYWERFKPYSRHLPEYRSRVDELKEIASKSGPEYVKYLRENVETKYKEFSDLTDATIKILNEKEFKVPFVKKAASKTSALVKKMLPKNIFQSSGRALSRLNPSNGQSQRDVEASVPAYADKAMKGGIDLTPDNLNLITRNSGSAIKFRLNPALLRQLQNAPGFTPVILNIRPLSNLPQFLGIAKTESSPVNA